MELCKRAVATDLCIDYGIFFSSANVAEPSPPEAQTYGHLGKAIAVKSAAISLLDLRHAPARLIGPCSGDARLFAARENREAFASLLSLSLQARQFRGLTGWQASSYERWWDNCDGFRPGKRLHLTDANLLDDFVNRNDEAAFEVPVWRHGTMVLSLCERILHDAHAAEDALPGNFLVLLARPARSARARRSAGFTRSPIACASPACEGQSLRQTSSPWTTCRHPMPAMKPTGMTFGPC